MSPRPRRMSSTVAFFVLAYLLSWSVWGSAIAHELGLIGWQLGAPLAFLAVPAAAVAVTAWSRGTAGLRDLGSRMVTWRVPVRWYLIALAAPGVPALAAVAVHVGLGGHHEIGSFVPVAGAVPLLLSQVLTHLLTEEVGWRGVALPRLRARFTPVVASLVLGVVWAGWHIPMFFVPGTRQSYPFTGFVLMVVSISIVMTWIFDRTRGSVLIAALFHAAMNTWWAVLAVLWGEARPFWLCVAFTVVLAAAVVVAQRRQVPAEHHPEQSAAAVDVHRAVLSADPARAGR